MKTHLLIPAAGSGQRFGGPVAKQYADLCGAPVIERTLQNLMSLIQFDSVSLGLAVEDKGWKSAFAWQRVTGGSSRAETVMRLLESLEAKASDEDWVWVQDSVRPFLSADTAARLVSATQGPGECFIAGLPATDTLKQVSANQLVERTFDRTAIWCAQTPQVCRFGTLKNALQTSLEQGLEITDEASALELQGIPVSMVLGSEENIKITRPGDMRLAEFIYSRRAGE